MGVFMRVSIAVMKHHDQSNCGRNEFVWLILPYHCSISKEVRTRIQMEEGADAEVVEGCCLRTCSSLRAQPVFL